MEHFFPCFSLVIFIPLLGDTCQYWQYHLQTSQQEQRNRDQESYLFPIDSALLCSPQHNRGKSSILNLNNFNFTFSSLASLNKNYLKVQSLMKREILW